MKDVSGEDWWTDNYRNRWTDDSGIDIRGAKLGASILFTSLGLPMIWMGEEFGDYQPLSQDSSKIDWTLLKNDANKNLLAHYKGLITLRKENSALTRDNLNFIYENNNDHVIAYSRWNDHGGVVVVIINFSPNFYSNYNITHFLPLEHGKSGPVITNLI